MLTIVFAAFNEAPNIRRFEAEVLPVFEELGQPYEILIMDDGSTDETAALASRLPGPVRLLRHDQNLGLGASLRTAFREVRGDIVVTMDADLTFEPRLVLPLLARFSKGDVDVVSGSPQRAGYGREIPTYRILVSRLATLFYSAVLGQRLTAVSPILRLYRARDLADLPLQARGFEINAEILFGLIRRGKRVAEIPAPLTQRIHGQSKLDYRREIRRHLALAVRMLAWRATSLGKLGG